ncbi:MAG: LysM peptidoglycan-binding domain-containing protein [Brevefilum sp.]|nr:LysM peptidoglycan-binding domain-containing protein [Brevefilum sp.]MDT8381821.1 LysM peptidoglycan-binding domain-containing protein [Brevefilum sp.]
MEASPNEDKPKENPAVKSCPFLGLVDDRESFTSYPSEWNVCYHVAPETTPMLSHQAAFCLNADYALCPIFKAETIQKIPDEIRLRRPISFEKIKKLGLIIVLIVLAFLVFIGIMFRERWLGQMPGFGSRISTETEMVNPGDYQTDVLGDQTKTELFSEIGLTPLVTEQNPTDTPVTPSPTKTDPILALDIPVGDEVQFVMHRVLPGESLAIFADQYNTSIDAIIAVNADLISPLWVDWVVIVPVDFSDVSGMPAFEAHQVEEEGISLVALSERLSAAVDQMALYNNIDEDHKLHAGEWLLVPRGNPNNN